jgi:hypothetical protein
MPTAMPDAPLASRFGKPPGSTMGSLVETVIGLAEVDRVLVQMPSSSSMATVSHARLGVAHGRRVIAVDVAEVALAVDQRIAHREILRQTHQRVVDRLVAVRMEITHHVADDRAHFLKPAAGSELQAQVAHGVENTAMHRLQTRRAHPAAPGA